MKWFWDRAPLFMAPFCVGALAGSVIQGDPTLVMIWGAASAVWIANLFLFLDRSPR